MIRDAFGLIFAADEILELRELVDVRSVSALPVGGRYRVIDFPLSNMVNSGIRNVGVIASHNYSSLMDHLGSGKSWDLARKDDGLFLLTPFAQKENTGTYNGMIDAFKANIDYIRRCSQEYCIISGSYTIYNTPYNEMMKFHVEKGADITVLTNNMDYEKYKGGRYSDVRLSIDGDERVTGIEFDPSLSLSPWTDMNTYIIRKDLLLYLIEDNVAKGEHRFASGVLRDNLKRLKIMAYKYDGYVARMHSVQAYYDFNMDLLDPQLQVKLLREHSRILTKIYDAVPAKYNTGASVKNSLLSAGVVIEGEVENSVVFRDVFISKGAKVKNCIIMPGTHVGPDAELTNVIIDKNVNIRRKTKLMGAQELPFIIRKGASV